jgi:hypothetical protein
MTKPVRSISKRFLVICAGFVLFSTGHGQIVDPFIRDLINSTSLDSLVSYVRILSGEDSVKIGPDKTIIKHRVSYRNNNLAADYLKQKLQGFNLVAIDEVYSTTGRNIFAIQTGTIFPDRQFIICAHYDAATDYAADDNATGVAAVIEAARILSAHQFPYTLVYALWDEEETGLFGSTKFATRARLNNELIEGVLNLDMLGYDQNDDGIMEIHSSNIAASAALASMMVTVNSLYGISLNPIVYNPGSNESDHDSFWKKNFGAVMVTEAYYGNDYNPNYHDLADRINQFNFNYFHNLAKLSVGTIVTLASSNTTSIADKQLNPEPLETQIKVYPNPVRPDSRIFYFISEQGRVEFSLLNSCGTIVRLLLAEYQDTGSYTIDFNCEGLPMGNYFIRMITRSGAVTRKVLLIN